MIRFPGSSFVVFMLEKSRHGKTYESNPHALSAYTNEPKKIEEQILRPMPFLADPELTREGEKDFRLSASVSNHQPI